MTWTFLKEFKLKLYCYTILLGLTLLSCSDNTDSCESIFYNPDLSVESPVILPDSIISSYEIISEISTDCLSSEIEIMLDCEICRLDSSFNIYDHIVVRLEQHPERSAQIIDTIQFNSNFIAKKSFCVDKILNQNSHILNFEFKNGAVNESRYFWDNIILEDSKKSVFEKTINEHDFIKSTTCELVNRVYLYPDPLVTCNSNKPIIVHMCVIGSAGWCFGADLTDYTIENVDEKIGEYIQLYRSDYEKFDLPCSGIQIYVTE